MSQKLFFAAYDSHLPTADDGLWVTDGTTTTEIGGVGNGGVSGSGGAGLEPIFLTPFGDDDIMFSGVDSSTLGNTNIWISDGSVSGTAEIGGPSNGITSPFTDGRPSDLDPHDFVTFDYGRKALFIATNDQNNGAGDDDLWVTDNTVSGTHELAGVNDANVANRGADWNPNTFSAFGSYMLFDATDAQGDTGLWITDGSAAGTVEIGGPGNGNVADHPANGGVDASNFTQLGDLMLFTANDGSNDPNALWVTDGTAAGTVEIGGAANAGVSGADKDAGLGDGLANAARLGDRLFFQGADNNGAAGLWVTDGTAGGTYEVGNKSDVGVAGAGLAGLAPTDLTVNGQEVLFNGVDSTGEQTLWVTDGVAADTKEIGGAAAPLPGEFASGLDPTDFVSLGNGNAVFIGRDASSPNGQLALWVTNGASGGTSEIGKSSNGPVLHNEGVADIGSTGFDFDTPGPSELIGGDGYAYFVGEDSAGQSVLWQTDGSLTGTKVLTATVAADQPATGISPNEMVMGAVPTSENTFSGGGKSINLASIPDEDVTLELTSGTADTVTGSNGTLNLGLAQAAAYGGGLLISLFSSAIDLYNTTMNNKDTVSFKGAGASSVTLHDAQANVVGGGQTITFATGTTGNYVYIEDTEGSPDTVNGSNGTIVLANAQAVVNGGSDTITLDGSSSDYANLFDTGANFDTVIGSHGKIGLNSAVAAVLGGSDTITLDGSSSDYANLFDTGANFDTVIGSHGKIGLNSAVAAVLGGSDTITLDGSSSDYANLFDTAANFDTVIGSHGKVGLNSAVAAVIGGSDTITLDGSSSDYANLFNTGANFDTVIGSHGKVGLNSAVAAVIGGSDTITLDGSSSDYANLFNTGANFDTVIGSGGKVGLNSAVAAVLGGSDTITLDGSSSDYANLFNTGANFDTVIGSGGKVGLNSAVAAVIGGSDTITLDGSSSDYANLFNTGANFDTVIGSGGKVGLNSAVAAVLGGSDTITLDGSSTDWANLFSTGANSDTVIGSSGRIGLNGVVAAVDGNSDELDFNGGSNSAALNGTGEALVFAAKFGVDSISGLAGSDGYFFSKSDFADFNALQAKMTPSGANNTLITLDAGDTVTLLGVNMNSLNENQFHFL